MGWGVGGRVGVGVACALTVCVAVAVVSALMLGRGVCFAGITAFFAAWLPEGFGCFPASLVCLGAATGGVDAVGCTFILACVGAAGDFFDSGIVTSSPRALLLLCGIWVSSFTWDSCGSRSIGISVLALHALTSKVHASNALEIFLFMAVTSFFSPVWGHTPQKSSENQKIFTASAFPLLQFFPSFQPLFADRLIKLHLLFVPVAL